MFPPHGGSRRRVVPRLLGLTRPAVPPLSPGPIPKWRTPPRRPRPPRKSATGSTPRCRSNTRVRHLGFVDPALGAWLQSQKTYRSWFFPTVIFALSGLLSLFCADNNAAPRSSNNCRERTAELTEAARARQLSAGDAGDGLPRDPPYLMTNSTLSFVKPAGRFCAHRPPCPAEEFLAGRVHLRDFIHPDDLSRVGAPPRARDSKRSAKSRSSTHPHA